MQLTTDQYMVKTKEQFTYAKEINQPYGEIDTILEWCKRELQDEWRWQLVDVSSPSSPGRYIFYFNGDKDFFAFSLKWA